MKIYDELVARGLIAQVTDEKEIRELVNSGKATFYIGFDPTADSLHVGHFVQVMVMAHMQRAGHTPIALFGGGTGMIGDPTGKTEMRKMLTIEEVQENIEKTESNDATENLFVEPENIIKPTIESQNQIQNLRQLMTLLLYL